jgi:hypothetical protein
LSQSQGILVKTSITAKPATDATVFAIRFQSVSSLGLVLMNERVPDEE